MKKLFILLLSNLLLCLLANATIRIIHVANYQFSPSTVNAFVGDTIRWTWDNGFHTTTSTSVPSGAPAWDKNINASSTTYDYILQKAGAYAYECVFHAPGMAGVLNVSAALPVTLADFSVITQNSNSALIKWSTLTEQNTNYFSVKRSFDGNKFGEIAQVKAAGNSSVLHSYNYVDADINSSNKYIYYMLEIVNTDGTSASSEIRMFSNKTASQKLITQLNPNPVTGGHLMFQFNADHDGKMTVQLFDESGKLIKSADMTAVKGLNNGHFHVADISAGVYNIVFRMDRTKEKRKLVIK